MSEQKTFGYLTSDTSKNTALAEYQSVKHFDSVHKATAGVNEVVTMRSGYDPRDYYSNRPQDTIPTKFKDVILACRKAYVKVNIVRNVIDLMTDFACEDIKLLHTDKNAEIFFKVWMAKVKLQDAVDEFVRHFLIDGNVVVKRRMAKISEPVQNQWLSTSFAAKETTPDPEKLYKEKMTNKREIPWRYSFLNVAALQWVGGDVAKITGEKRLAFYPSADVLKVLRNPSDPFQKSIVNRIPVDVKQNLSSRNIVEVDMDYVYVAHNKKDSWEDWAPPFLYSILSDVHFKDKLRQAEISAIDGVINVIRLWKLGDHTKDIFPGESAVNKLIGILENNTGGGTMDIVWDSMIDMKEYYPPIDKILGSEKYQQVNRDILIGLGVPEVLIGGQGANFSNSWIQLKTLIEKLKYIRNKVREWLEKEVSIVCEAMGFSTLPRIKFPQNNLEDENINRKLIIGLLDRGVISVESVLQAYGEDFLIEAERIKEQKSAGIKPKSPFDQKINNKGNTGGRPSQTQDVDRKTRTAKPRRASAELVVKAMDIIDIIDENIIPTYLESINVSNARKLTSSQREDIDNLRVIILSCIRPSDEIDKELISDIAINADTMLNDKLVKAIRKNLDSFTEKKKSQPTLNQKKRIEATAWANYHLGV